MDLSVVIPAHNEAENSGPWSARSARRSARPGSRWEVVVVDDGSATAPARAPGRGVRGAASDGPAIRRRGAELRRGDAACAPPAPWVATLDGDGQNDPADILRLLAARDRSRRPAAGRCCWPGTAQAGGTPGSSACRPVWRTACAAGCSATARPRRGAASSCSSARRSWRCRTSTTCTGSSRRCSCAPAAASCRSRWATAPVPRAVALRALQPAVGRHRGHVRRDVADAAGAAEGVDRLAGPRGRPWRSRARRRRRAQAPVAAPASVAWPFRGVSGPDSATPMPGAGPDAVDAVRGGSRAGWPSCSPTRVRDGWAGARAGDDRRAVPRSRATGPRRCGTAWCWCYPASRAHAEPEACTGSSSSSRIRRDPDRGQSAGRRAWGRCSDSAQAIPSRSRFDLRWGATALTAAVHRLGGARSPARRPVAPGRNRCGRWGTRAPPTRSATFDDGTAAMTRRTLRRRGRGDRPRRGRRCALPAEPRRPWTSSSPGSTPTATSRCSTCSCACSRRSTPALDRRGHPRHGAGRPRPRGAAHARHRLPAIPWPTRCLRGVRAGAGHSRHLLRADQVPHGLGGQGLLRQRGGDAGAHARLAGDGDRQPHGRPRPHLQHHADGERRRALPGYRPRVLAATTTEGATVLGELRVSGFLLDRATARPVVSFRPGYLRNPWVLPEALRGDGLPLQLVVHRGQRPVASAAAPQLRPRARAPSCTLFDFPVTIEDEEAPPLMRAASRPRWRSPAG